MASTRNTTQHKTARTHHPRRLQRQYKADLDPPGRWWASERCEWHVHGDVRWEQIASSLKYRSRRKQPAGLLLCRRYHKNVQTSRFPIYQSEIWQDSDFVESQQSKQRYYYSSCIFFFSLLQIRLGLKVIFEKLFSHRNLTFLSNNLTQNSPTSRVRVRPERYNTNAIEK